MLSIVVASAHWIPHPPQGITAESQVHTALHNPRGAPSTLEPVWFVLQETPSPASEQHGDAGPQWAWGIGD